MNISTIKRIAVIVISVAVIISFYIMSVSIDKLKDSNDVLSSNNKSLTTGVKTLTVKNGDLMTQVGGLIVDKDKLKSENEQLLKNLKDIGIKYKDISSVATVLAEENRRLRLQLYDSIVINTVDSIQYIDTVKCFSKSDKYFSITGCISNDSVDLKYSSIVPLDIVMSKTYKHKILWWRWGVINEKLTVTSENKSVSFPTVKLYIPK